MKYNSIEQEKDLEEFNLHDLTIQDINHGNQRNKFESYDHYDIIFLRNFDRRSKYDDSIIIVWEKNYKWVLIFDEISNVKDFSKNIIADPSKGEEFIWNTIRQRINYHAEEIKLIKKELKELQDDILKNNKYHTNEIFAIKNAISNTEIEIEDFWFAFKNLYKSNKKSYYWLDLKDHAQKFLNSINKIENSANLLMSIDRDVSDARTNDINKILTMVATAFVPPTFICSVYGMNFVNMPELKNVDSYKIFWVLILIWSIIVYLFFRKKNWI